MTAVHQISKSTGCSAISEASETLQKLKSKALELDVIFLDLNMPVMNRQQFLTEIKKYAELQAIPIIIFSTTFHYTTVQLVKELGAIDFVKRNRTRSRSYPWNISINYSELDLLKLKNRLILANI